jgi:hypothetical protein
MLIYTIFDEAFDKGGTHFERSTEDYEFAKLFYELTEKLVAAGKLQTHPEKCREGGLRGALREIEEMKQGMVCGEKWVSKINETP